MKQRLVVAAVAFVLGFVCGVAAEERVSSPIIGPMDFLTTGVSVARVGTRDIAVWHADGVRLSVIDADGVPTASRIVAYTYERRPPRILAAGDRVQVFWTDQGVLRRRIFDSEGRPTDKGMVLATGVDYPSVARSGSVTGVMVEPYEAGSTFTGSVLLTFDDDGHEIGRCLVWGRARAYLATLGEGFVSAQWSESGVQVRRLTSSGQGLDPIPIRVGDATNDGVLVSSGELAWIVTRPGTSLRLAAVDATGRVTVSRQVPPPVSFVTTSGLEASARPDGLVVLAGLDDDVYRFRFGTNGSSTEATTKVVSGTGRQWARAVSSGSRELVFWSEQQQQDIRVQQDGVSRLMTLGGSYVETVSAAASHDRILLAWRDRLGSTHVYRYAFLDSSGSPLGEPVTFDTYEGIYDYDDPQVAWSGREFGLLWTANQNPRLLRFGDDGSALGETQLAGLPDKPILVGGHDRLIGVSSGIVARELGASGVGPSMTLTTPIPPPQGATSGDSGPILLADEDGFRLAYNSTFYYDCVGIPCPEETSVYIVDLSKDLVPVIATRTQVAQYARLFRGAISGSSAALLTSRGGLSAQIVPRGGEASSPRVLWERTGAWPMLGAVAIAGREGGFAVALRQQLSANVDWTSVHQLGIDGTTEDVRVVPASRVSSSRLVRTDAHEVVVYVKSLPEEGGGRALFADRWHEAPAAPGFPSVPIKVTVRELTPPFVEVRWEYEGPSLVAFTISTGPYESTVVLPPDSRSHIFASLARQFRVMAINEAGTAASIWVEPKKERVRGVRR